METTTHTIFVRLLNENIDVWRPVQAMSLGDNIFRIIEQPYDRSNERWQFEPGAFVECRSTQLFDSMHLVAFKRADTG